MKPPIITNRKPADELAWIREQIKELEGREDYIKRMILAGEFDAQGDEFDALVETKTQQRLDRDAVAAALGDLSGFMKPVEFRICRLKRKAEA